MFTFRSTFTLDMSPRVLAVCFLVAIFSCSSEGGGEGNPGVEDKMVKEEGREHECREEERRE